MLGTYSARSSMSFMTSESTVSLFIFLNIMEAASAGAIAYCQKKRK